MASVSNNVLAPDRGGQRLLYMSKTNEQYSDLLLFQFLALKFWQSCIGFAPRFDTPY